MYAAMSNRPNHDQIEALVDFLERNPGIAKGSLRTALGKDLVKKRWNEVSSFLNGLGTVTKDGKGWAKFWAEKKCVLKKKCLQLQVGPLEDPPTFTDLEKRMIAMIGVAEVTDNSFGDSMEDTFNNFPEIQEDVDIKVPNLSSRSSYDGFPTASSPIQPCYDDEEPLANSRHSPYNTSNKRSRSEADIDLARLERIEEKRVKAERIRSGALHSLAGEVARHAAAVDGLAEAVRESGQTIAAGIQTAGQNIADAIMKISQRFGAF